MTEHISCFSSGKIQHPLLTDLHDLPVFAGRVHTTPQPMADKLLKLSSTTPVHREAIGSFLTDERAAPRLVRESEISESQNFEISRHFVAQSIEC